ncbi:hypothetical protein V6N13_104766 [Hibiscus sabdariffa]
MERWRWQSGGLLVRPWLDDLGPLVHHCITAGAIGMNRTVIANMDDDDGNWVWGKFQEYSPINVLLRIAAKKDRKWRLGAMWLDGMGEWISDSRLDLPMRCVQGIVPALSKGCDLRVE